MRYLKVGSISSVNKIWLASIVISALMLVGSGAYCVNAWQEISSLYTQLRQQRSLLEIRGGQRSFIVENLRLIEENRRPKLLTPEEVSPAMANLSLRMAEAGLTETFFKMERSEIRRESDGMSGVYRMAAECTGGYEQVIAYLDELTNGDTYYFLENVRIIRDGSGARLRLSCVIVGYGSSPYAAAPEIPAEYLYVSPFD